jgi:TonB family protein
MVVLVFLVQLGLIFWLGSPASIRPRPAAQNLTFRFAETTATELLALTDPTLFALPHQLNPAVPARPKTPRPEYHSFQWPAPTNQLLPALGQAGTAANRLVEPNDFPALQLPASPPSSPTIPELSPPAVSAGQSALQLEGGLAGRRLLAPFELKSWPNPEILASSVVEVAVDAEGRPVSVRLLSGSGLAAADQLALDQAKAARFEPADRDQARAGSGPTAQLSWGRMNFRWHTVPAQPADTPAASP